jgi:hypothetical protein
MATRFLILYLIYSISNIISVVDASSQLHISFSLKNSTTFPLKQLKPQQSLQFLRQRYHGVQPLYSWQQKLLTRTAAHYICGGGSRNWYYAVCGRYGVGCNLYDILVSFVWYRRQKNRNDACEIWKYLKGIVRGREFHLRSTRLISPTHQQYSQRSLPMQQ